MVVDELTKDFSRTHKVDLWRRSPSDVEVESVSHGGGSLAVVRRQATESKWSLSPRALATFMMVAKLGLPSAESAL